MLVVISHTTSILLRAGGKGSPASQPKASEVDQLVVFCLVNPHSQLMPDTWGQKWWVSCSSKTWFITEWPAKWNIQLYLDRVSPFKHVVVTNNYIFITDQLQKKKLFWFCNHSFFKLANCLAEHTATKGNSSQVPFPTQLLDTGDKHLMWPSFAKGHILVLFEIHNSLKILFPPLRQTCRTCITLGIDHYSSVGGTWWKIKKKTFKTSPPKKKDLPPNA